jgi:hypothetical protein
VKVTVGTHLAASPEEVWEVVTRWEEQPRWMVDAGRVEVSGGRRAGLGTRVAATTLVLGLPVLREVLEVTEWVPASRLGLAHRSLVRGHGEWRLRRTERGTRFLWREELSLPVPVMGELVLRIYRPLMALLMRRSLSNLARVVEARGGLAVAPRPVAPLGSAKSPLGGT